MSFAGQQAIDASIIINTSEHAISIEYDGTDIDAIVNYRAADDSDHTNRSKATKAEILIKVSDVTTPTYDKPIVIGSDTWKVIKPLEGNAVFWKVLIEKDKRPRIA